MSKEHKIVVTRDTDGTLCLWKHSTTLVIVGGNWDYDNFQPSDRLIQDEVKTNYFKEHFGFLPRKGSKQVITITRAKK